MILSLGNADKSYIHVRKDQLMNWLPICHWLLSPIRKELVRRRKTSRPVALYTLSEAIFALITMINVLVKKKSLIGKPMESVSFARGVPLLTQLFYS